MRVDKEFDLKQANLEGSVECAGREVKYLATQSCETQTRNGSTSERVSHADPQLTDPQPTDSESVFNNSLCFIGT